MQLLHTKEAKLFMLSQADELLIAIILKNTKVSQAQVDQALADCQTAKNEGRDLDLAHANLSRKWPNRAETYNRGTCKEPGVAETIIAKQRNGPTGMVKLTFLNTLTRFETLAGSSDDF